MTRRPFSGHFENQNNSITLRNRVVLHGADYSLYNVSLDHDNTYLELFHRAYQKLHHTSKYLHLHRHPPWCSRSSLIEDLTQSSTRQIRTIERRDSFAPSKT